MTAELIRSLGLGLLLSTLIALLAWRRGSLTPSGAAGTVVVGTLVFGLGGWVWGVVLVVFFVSSSALSHYKEAEKEAAAEKFEKGHQRDLGQVGANGGLGALLALGNTLFPTPLLDGNLWFYLYIGVIATVTADTWATELGTLSKSPPRLITNGRVVEVGTSGGVSVLGTTVSLLGGATIGLTAGLLGSVAGLIGASVTGILTLILTGAIGGLAGSLIDSLLGATVQQIYYCDHCHKDTERQVHHCGHETRPLRGLSWLNNDLVNLIASAGGGLVAAATAFLLT